MRKGLSDRVTSIIPKLEEIRIWDVSTDYENSSKNISIGFILNSEEALIVLHKGPGANLPEAEEFR